MATAFAPSDDALSRYAIEPRRLGRPTSYTPELAERICEAVKASQGGLRAVLAEDASLPALGCVLQWQARYPEFDAALAHARQTRFKTWADDLADIAMDETLDPQSRRLILDTKRWLLSKELHRVYGDKLDLTTGGETLQASSVNIDQRIQSIMMQAAARAGGGLIVDGLSPEALSLLE